MIDGLAVVDAHIHVPRLSTVSPAWMAWAARFGQDSGWRKAFGPDGDPVPARLDALLAAEGVDVALLFAEYSPRATGIQPVEDLLPIISFGAKQDSKTEKQHADFLDRMKARGYTERQVRRLVEWYMRVKQAG